MITKPTTELCKCRHLQDYHTWKAGVRKGNCKICPCKKFKPQSPETKHLKAQIKLGIKPYGEASSNSDKTRDTQSQKTKSEDMVEIANRKDNHAYKKSDLSSDTQSQEQVKLALTPDAPKGLYTPETKTHGDASLSRRRALGEDKTRETSIFDTTDFSVLKPFDEEMSYFCKKINWGSIFLDAKAIQFMNTGFGYKAIVETERQRLKAEVEKVLDDLACFGNNCGAYPHKASKCSNGLIKLENVKKRLFSNG